jgi:WhiB family redox-sensing transcriptional regulator
VNEINDIPDEYAWMLHSLCRGADTREFFPSNGLGVEAAQRICRTCPVQEPCLEYALTHRIEQGVWGGASERERRRILRRRRREGVVTGESVERAVSERDVTERGVAESAVVEELEERVSSS